MTPCRRQERLCPRARHPLIVCALTLGAIAGDINREFASSATALELDKPTGPANHPTIKRGRVSGRHSFLLTVIFAAIRLQTCYRAHTHHRILQLTGVLPCRSTPTRGFSSSSTRTWRGRTTPIWSGTESRLADGTLPTKAVSSGS